MNMFGCHEFAAPWVRWSLTIIAASAVLLGTAAPQANAQVSVDSLPNLTRGFGFSLGDPDLKNNDSYEFYVKGDPWLETFKEYLRRDNINFVLGVVTGDRPGFIKMTESAAVEGSVEIIRKQWGVQGSSPSNRVMQNART